MRTITKTVHVDVYTPQEALDDLLHNHDNLAFVKDKIFTDGKFNVEVLDRDPFVLGLGLICTDFNDYLRGLYNYYIDDFFAVFEQDNKLYALTYIP